MKISVFFRDTLGANLVNSRWSWGAVSPDTNRLFLRVWQDHVQTVGGFQRVSLLRTSWEGASAGFEERKRHVDMLRNGAEGYGVVCIAKDPTASKRTIKSFDHDSLLKLGQLIKIDDHVYAQITDRVSVNDLARNRTANSSIIPDIKAILRKRLDVTTIETLASARVGQGEFRAKVLANWRSQCCVTGSITLDAIRASHIKPWRVANDYERLDPNNGLPLIATLDALFDSGMITFASDGELLISQRLSQQEKTLLGLIGLRLVRQPNEKTKEYLSFHQTHIFADRQVQQNGSN